jgi:hypothetical protein
MCQQLARLRHADAYDECRLSGVKRKQCGHSRTVAFDPLQKRLYSAASNRIRFGAGGDQWCAALDRVQSIRAIIRRLVADGSIGAPSLELAAFRRP